MRSLHGTACLMSFSLIDVKSTLYYIEYTLVLNISLYTITNIIEIKQIVTTVPVLYIQIQVDDILQPLSIWINVRKISTNIDVVHELYYLKNMCERNDK